MEAYGLLCQVNCHRLPVLLSLRGDRPVVASWVIEAYGLRGIDITLRTLTDEVEEAVTGKL